MVGDGAPRSEEQAFIEELEQARASQARRPDFFVVGHAKCGTTALHKMLDAHPQIFMPVFKETQFLSRAPYERAAFSKRRPSLRPETLAAYMSLFADAPAGQLAGEASTEYLRTPAAAGRIAALCPDARIVMAFREPASFLRSLHLQLLEVTVEAEGDFARAIDLEADRSEGRNIPRDCSWPPALLYSQHVRYTEQLRAYHEHFGRERVLVLIYDDFRADNEGVVREVFRFLGVDDSLAIEPVEANRTVHLRSRRVHELISSIAVGRTPMTRAVKKGLEGVTPTRVRRGALRAAKRVAVDDSPRSVDEQLMATLRQRHRGEVVALSEYLGRDLVSLWGYEDVPASTVGAEGP